jgi:hypothetical protein
VISVRLKATTRTLGPPPGWDQELDGPCGFLHIVDDLLNGSSVMMSGWKPAPEELAALNAGGFVALGVVGTVHPPVIVAVYPSHVVDEAQPS